MTTMLPNRRRAAELKIELVDALAQYAETSDRPDIAAAFREEIDELRHQIFLTGATDEDA